VRGAAAVVLLAGACFPALACAPVPPMGATVDIANEEAIIVWDSPSKTQHFIRRASFNTTAKDFGFLVPTPSVPQLAEADDAAFDMLSQRTAARVIKREMTVTSSLLGMLGALFPSEKSERKMVAKAAAAPPAPVRVLASATVAGFDAVVLEADDAGALDAWLKKSGYVSSPELVEWYKPYIAQKWKITAFKIAANAPQVPGASVRMSFKTDTPFFPYREPAQAAGAKPSTHARLLRVFLLSDVRFAGSVGPGGNWPGTAVWSDKLPDHALEYLVELTKLPAGLAKQSPWLTEFEDKSSPRPGTDEVFFKRATDQATVKRPDIYIGPPLWLDLLVSAVILAVLGGIGWLLFRLGRGILRRVMA
jgi:hypothetical protein